MKPLAILTCEQLATHPDGQMARDDQHFLDELVRQSVRFELVPWTKIHDPSKYRALIIRTTWDYVDRWQEFLQFLDRAASLGVAEWVLKPLISATSQGLIKVQAQHSAAALLQMRANYGDFLMQPYLDGIQAGEVSLIYLAGQFSHAVKKTPARSDFRVQETFGGTHQRHDPSPEDLRFGDQVLAALPGEVCMARVDFLYQTEKRHLMEVELIEPALFLGSSREPPCERWVNALLRDWIR